MAIRLAIASDARLLLQHLRATPNPPNMQEEQIAPLLERFVVTIDDVTGAACALAPDAGRQSFIWPVDFSADPGANTNPPGVVDIPWLLPRASWNIDNIDDFPPVLLAALDELVARLPAADLWPCGGEFEGEVVQDRQLRLAKSREIGEFWKSRWLPQIRVVEHPNAGVYRAEAESVKYLRDSFRKVVRRG